MDLIEALNNPTMLNAILEHFPAELIEAEVSLLSPLQQKKYRFFVLKQVQALVTELMLVKSWQQVEQLQEVYPKLLFDKAMGLLSDSRKVQLEFLKRGELVVYEVNQALAVKCRCGSIDKLMGSGQSAQCPGSLRCGDCFSLLQWFNKSQFEELLNRCGRGYSSLSHRRYKYDDTPANPSENSVRAQFRHTLASLELQILRSDGATALVKGSDGSFWDSIPLFRLIDIATNNPAGQLIAIKSVPENREYQPDGLADPDTTESTMGT
ncbi:MAG: hypothetical protein F6K58_19780 [Symploca sp. SIO2E9]|nr:hypothetical protein [Symploca sp. SIO2E9]